MTREDIGETGKRVGYDESQDAKKERRLRGELAGEHKRRQKVARQYHSTMVWKTQGKTAQRYLNMDPSEHYELLR
jgi:hypothetical protein